MTQSNKEIQEKKDSILLLKKEYKNKLMKGWVREKTQTFEMLNTIFISDAKLGEEIYRHLKSQPGFYDLSINGLIRADMSAWFSSGNSIYSYILKNDPKFADKALRFLALRGLQKAEINIFKEAIQSGKLSRKGVDQYQASLQFSWYQWLLPWNWVKSWRYSKLSKIIEAALKTENISKLEFQQQEPKKSESPISKASTYSGVSEQLTVNPLPSNLPKPLILETLQNPEPSSLPATPNEVLEQSSDLPSTPLEVNNSSDLPTTPSDVNQSSLPPTPEEVTGSQSVTSSPLVFADITCTAPDSSGKPTNQQFVGIMPARQFNQIEQVAVEKQNEKQHKNESQKPRQTRPFEEIKNSPTKTATRNENHENGTRFLFSLNQ